MPRVKRTLLLFLLLPHAAAADPYRNAISLQLATLDPQAASVEWDHDLGAKKLSVVGAIGARGGAMGDFTSRAIGAGVELRRWLSRAGAMRGFYAGARGDISRTTLSTMDRAIGGLTTVQVGATFGYRFVLLRAVELTPSLGLAAIIEDGASRAAPSIGLTAGWIF
jgi:hypothetical protein